MQTTIYIILAFAMGLTMSIYLPMNSSVAKYIGSSITANVTFFTVALLTSILILLISGRFHTIIYLNSVPAYLYLAGFVSAFVVLGTTFLIPHIGARKFFILLIAGQVLMAIVVSHFGLLESPKDPVNMKKMIGAVLLPLSFSISNVKAHCEIPCGIDDDQLRTQLIAEHATTIEKSMKQIMALSKANPTNNNQMVRWVSNKKNQ